MAVADANYVFLYADVGTNGRVSDGCVWNQCDLRHYIESGEAGIPENTALGEGVKDVCPMSLLQMMHSRLSHI